MATMRGLSSLILVMIVLAAMIYGSVDAKKDKQAAARKSDIKYIKCDVCEEIVKQLVRQYKKKKDEVAPKKITEFQVIEMTEKVCDVKRDEGEWIAKLDIVEDGDALKLVEQSSLGECGTECKTIQKACQEIVGDHDTDLAEALYAGENRAALSKLLCRQLSKACAKKPPPVPKDRQAGEDFVVADAEAAKMEKMLQKMNVKPSVFHDVKDEDIPNAPKMKMYSRDDLMKGAMPGMKGGDEDEDEEEEEEEEATKPPPKMKFSMKDLEEAKAGEEKGKDKDGESGGGILGKAADVAGAVKDRTKKWLGDLVKKQKDEAKAEL